MWELSADHLSGIEKSKRFSLFMQQTKKKARTICIAVKHVVKGEKWLAHPQKPGRTSPIFLSKRTVVP